MQTFLHVWIKPAKKAFRCRWNSARQLWEIEVPAPPTKNQANRALQKYLAELLGIPFHQITLLKGTQSREKVLKVEGISPQTLQARLHAASK
ncbi:MAG: DUF167 domain-containing protein [Bacteroidia bacterium]